MTGSDIRGSVIEHLQQAIESDDPGEKNFHVRTALQYLEPEAAL